MEARGSVNQLQVPDQGTVAPLFSRIVPVTVGPGVGSEPGTEQVNTTPELPAWKKVEGFVPLVCTPATRISQVFAVDVASLVPAFVTERVHTSCEPFAVQEETVALTSAGA